MAKDNDRENYGHDQAKGKHYVPVQWCIGDADREHDGQPGNQDDCDADGDEGKEACEDCGQQGQTLRRLKLAGGNRPESEVGEDHPADPDDDTGQMQEM